VTRFRQRPAENSR